MGDTSPSEDDAGARVAAHRGSMRTGHKPTRGPPASWHRLPNGVSTGGLSRRRSSSSLVFMWLCRLATGFSRLGGPRRTALAAGRDDRRGSRPHRPAANLAADRHRHRHRVHHAGQPARRRPVAEILTNNKLFADHPGGLLAAGGMVWATNVIAFGLWYWDLDRGGAAARAHHPDRNPAFIFPEMQHKEYAPAAGCRSLSTTFRWPSGPPPRSAPPTFQRSGRGPSSS